MPVELYQRAPPLQLAHDVRNVVLRRECDAALEYPLRVGTDVGPPAQSGHLFDSNFDGLINRQNRSKGWLCKAARLNPHSWCSKAGRCATSRLKS